jgi:NAD(P)-dependent dehydrogenase (short-subunit alcohol dehydrogenase family)
MMPSMHELQLQPTTGVVITGGASGIGLATAHAVAAVGRPVAVWDLHQDRATEAAEALAAEHGVSTVGMAVDVRETEALADAADTAVEAIGTVGGVVHAAGVPDAVDLPDLTDKTWDPLLEVNLRAYAMVVQALLPQLRANAPDAAVVGIASIHAIVANPANPAYAASKAGVLGLTRSMAVRFATEGIRVNAICPGFIDTPMLPDIEDLRSRFERSAPMGRLGRASEIGTTVRFLLSTEASFITGTQIVVDGGCTIVDM